jgi:hypothetical protein
MARTSPIFNNFTGGERSPKTIGRTDTKAYFSSCYELTNMWVVAQGGVEKRPGFKYIATTTTPTGTETNVRLQEFKFSAENDQNFVLEFANGNIYFFSDGGAVLTGGGSRYSILSGISNSYLRSLRFAQMLDEMVIVSPYFKPKKLIRWADDDWEIENVSLSDGPWTDENKDTEWTIRPTDVSGANITFYVEGDALPDECLVNSYVKIRQDLTFSGSLSAENTFTSAIYLDAGDRGIVSLGGTWVATAMLQKSYDGGTTWVDYLSFTGNTAREILEIEDNIYYRVGVPTGMYSSGTVEARIVKKDVVGKALITEVSDSNWFLATIHDEDLAATTATYKWCFSAFNSYSGYPRAVAFYEGRLLFAGTYKQPQTIWASKVDDYFNFNTGTDDDDAYSYTFTSSDLNDIMWMVGTDVLRIGTKGGEWKFGKRDEPTTPTSVDVKQHSNNGSGNVPGLLIGSSVVYVQRGKTKLRQMYYDYASDRYLSPEISIIAEHLARKGIIDLKFSNNPDPIIWMTTNEGTLVACTYNTDQEIIAFHEHETDGDILSVAVIPGTDRDEVWIAVRRQDTEGEMGDYYYVEQMTTQFWEDIEDAIYLDSAITAEDTDGMTSVTGLTHLERKTVKVITDGSVHPDCVVSGGSITLNWTAYKVHVGLAYTATVKTMPLEPGVEGGSSVGHKKKGFRVAMGLYRTNHCKVGTDTSNLDIVPFRTSAMSMNAAIPAYTGVRKVWLDKGSADEFSLMAVSDVPLPFALTYISPVVYSSPS